MKSIFMVRKDANKPFGEGNWLVMTGKEFYEYKKKNDLSKKYFAKYFNNEKNCITYFIECDKKTNNELATERMRKKREIDYLVENDIKKYSLSKNFDEKIKENKYYFELEDVENRVSAMQDYERLKQFVKGLTKQEKTILKYLIINSENLSNSELSRRIGVPRMTLAYQKDKILEKLKKYFNYF